MSEISTDRLRLEPLVESHAALLFSGLSAPQLYDYIDEDAPRSINSVRSRFKSLEKRKSPAGDQDWLNWAIYAINEHSYVGYVQATVFGDGQSEIAYVIFHDCWGRGFAAEAVRAMSENLRSEYAVTTLTATVNPANQRSRRVLCRLDFESKGFDENGNEIFLKELDQKRPW